MPFQPLAIAPMMKSGGRGAESLNCTVYLSGAVMLLDRGEQGRARDRDALRRLGDAVEGGLDVLRGELGAVVELHALAQHEGVGLAVLGDLPAVGEVGMMVLPESRGSRRTRLSNMQPWLPRLLIVPDWWKSKCGGRMVMPYFRTPPDLGLGSGALSWNFEPSNSMGTPCARAGQGMPNAAAPSAADPLTN
jgi:hypothetical protein